MGWHCADCGVKKKDKRGRRCYACANRLIGQERTRNKKPNHCLDCGDEISRKAKRCLSCSSVAAARDRYGPPIIPVCSGCDTQVSRKGYLCRSCSRKRVCARPGQRKKMSNTTTALYRDRPELKEAISASVKKRWEEDDEYRNAVSGALKRHFSNQKNRERLSRSVKLAHARGAYEGIYSDPERNRKLSEVNKAARKRGAYDHIMQPTKLCKRIGSELRHLNFCFEYEYRIGYRYFDIYIPELDLLIEVDGEFWHYSDYARAKGIPDKDEKKTRLALGNGYKFHRIRETDMNRLGSSAVVSNMLNELFGG